MERITAAFAALFVWTFAQAAVAASDSDAASKAFGGQEFDIPNPAHGGRGGEIYLSTCAHCHDAGLDRAPQRLMFSYMSPQSIYRTLTDGAMKAQAQGLSEQDRIAVAEFVTRRKMSDTAAQEPPMCRGKAARFDAGEPPIFRGWGLGADNRRFIPRDIAGIDKANVGKLHLKWAVAFPNAIQVRSEPALAGGAIYIGSHNGEVYALDRATGCARWIFQAGAEVRSGIVVSPWKAGDATAKPLVFFGDIVGNVYAVDARDGRLTWRVRADENSTATITGAPALYENTLYVPVSSLEGVRPIDPHYECCTFRGSVLALNTATGAVAWRTYMTDTPRIVGRNAAGANQYAPSGAPIWDSPAIDGKRKQIYVGTGENYSSPTTDKSDAIIALDLASGAVKWVYQGQARDAENLACFAEDKTNCPKENGPDFDFGAGIVLATASNGRQLVIGGEKSGIVHAVDPDTGKLVWKERAGRGGTLGGVHFGMAANAEAIFVPVNDAENGRTYMEPANPGVFAFDLASGDRLWAAPQSACPDTKPCRVGYSQAVTATPDLVVAGSADGWMRAFDARSGAMLWQVDTKAPVRTVNGTEATGGAFGGGAGPILYHGVLYASSGYSLAGMKPGNLLLAFEAK